MEQEPQPTVASRLAALEGAVFGDDYDGAETPQEPTQEAPVDPAPVPAAAGFDPAPASAPAAAPSAVPATPRLGAGVRKEIQERCTYLEALNGRRVNAIKSCRERAEADDAPGAEHWNAQADNLKLLHDVDRKQLDKLKLELA